MWPYQHLNQDVSSPLNDAEEVASRPSYSSSPPMPSLANSTAGNPQMSTSSGTTARTRRSSVDEVEPNNVDAIGPFQEGPSRAMNISPPPSGRSRSPIRFRPACWRRRIYLPPTPPLPPLSDLRRSLWPLIEETEESESEDEVESPDPLEPPEADCSTMDELLIKSLETYVLSVRPSVHIPLRDRKPPASHPLWAHRHSGELRSCTGGQPSAANRAGEDVESDSDDEPLPDDGEDQDAPGLGANAPPEPSPHRRHLNFTQHMPQPNILAKQVADRVIKFARSTRNVHEEDMCCLNCGLFPIYPITGKCGHTRCTKCINVTTRCPCGKEAQQPLYVNIIIRNLLQKTADSRTVRVLKESSSCGNNAVSAKYQFSEGLESCAGPIRVKRTKRPALMAAPGEYNHRIPMSARARFSHAMELLQAGRYRDAAPHLAIAAASYHADLRVARTILAQVVMVLISEREPRGLTRELNHFVRQLTSMSWVKTEDMECILCSDIFTKPVTTPCGHMFCRTCLEKTLDYRKRCPLCLRGLEAFQLAETNDTMLVKGALASINALNIPKPVVEDDLLPIFVCTVAYPSVPCPLFIFDPRYWLMIRRVLESGSRRFGMVAMDRDKKYADFGTILEVRDCVHLEDGRSILSTVGLTRFRVIERCVRDGCEVARIQHIRDVAPDDTIDTDELKVYASRIMLKALFWLSQLSPKVLSDIENAFGNLPNARDAEDHDEWWKSFDGPTWLWWLVAVLPIRTEIKVLILSTDCLIKRMMAVARTLEAIDRIAFTTVNPGNCEVRVSMAPDAENELMN